MNFEKSYAICDNSDIKIYSSKADNFSWINFTKVTMALLEKKSGKIKSKVVNWK